MNTYNGDMIPLTNGSVWKCVYINKRNKWESFTDFLAVRLELPVDFLFWRLSIIEQQFIIYDYV